MDDKQTILNRIYKLCFSSDYIRESFQRDWKFVYETLADGDEESIPQEVLSYVDLWLDII